MPIFIFNNGILIRVLAQLDKTSSNVNQIARAVNSGDDPNNLADDIKAVVIAIAGMQALEHKR